MSEQLHLWPDEQPGERIRWSISREKRLRDCHRKYYLQHYGSRGGSKADAPIDVRDAYVLKHLRNRHMWVGEVVHEMIELALSTWRRGDSVPVAGLVERGTRRMRAQYAESIQGVYRERPRSAYGLVEHEYREEISRDEWKSHRDRMEKCLRTFFDLELARRIRDVPAWRWLAVETLGSFEHDAATVMVKPDFAWRDDDDQVVMVDWKTGKPRPEEEWLQLAVYGLYARSAWGLGGDQLRGAVVYLDSGQVRDVQLDRDDLTRAEEAIRESLGRMRKLGSDAGSQPAPELFPMTDDLTSCRLCSFRRLCGRQ